jgi:hypothetical protein
VHVTIYTIHIKERIAAAMITMNGIQNIRKISLRTALQLFKLKLTPIITYGINIYWDHLKRSNLEDIEKVKARFLKKAMCLSKYTPSHLVYTLSRESFYIEDLRHHLLLPSTNAYRSLLQSLHTKRIEIWQEFYSTDAMANTGWMKANYELRHIMMPPRVSLSNLQDR